MNLVNTNEYRKLKSELGLTVDSIERRLLNISHGDLTEDLLINAIMKEASDTGGNDSGAKSRHRPGHRPTSSNFYYDEHSESGGKPAKEHAVVDSDQKAAANLDNQEPLSKRSQNSKRNKKSDTNSAGKTGSSSNRFFEKRKSSSKSDVETARFNRVEGLASSRNFENSKKQLSSKRSRIAKTVDLRINEEGSKAENEGGQFNVPLMNTVSTIKPTDQFELLNNSSSKNQKNLLKQLERHVRYPTGVLAAKREGSQESFEFTQIESRNVSSNPTIAYELIARQNLSQDQAVSDLPKCSNLKETTSSNHTRTMQSSGDQAAKVDEDKRLAAKRVKKGHKSNSQDIAGPVRKGSKSKDIITKKVIDNITRVLESINKNSAKSTLTKEERNILDSINSLHVFEFRNACVLGLDLKDSPELYRASEGSLLSSVHFKQLIHNIGILRIKDCTVKQKLLSQVTHSNIILLALNRCTLSSLTFLTNLTSLKLLNVSDNCLSSFAGIQKCSSLTELYANNNQISGLQELRSLRSLRILSIAQNTVAEFSEFQGLKKCPELSYLKVAGNPICVSRDLSLSLHSLLPKLKTIDHFEAEVVAG